MNNYVKDDDLETIRQIFFEECGEQLSLLEEELSSLEETTEASEKINTIFRAVHSIKGARELSEWKNLFGFLIFSKQY